MTPTIENVIRAMSKLGHTLFKEGDYNLNIIGIRSSDDTANSFNDWLCVLYRHNDSWALESFRCTTDPGMYYRLNPMSLDGTAILKPGQYRNAWRIGEHQGRYEALVQHRPVTVYRDNDHDAALDTDGTREQTGFFGINCHRARSVGRSIQVDKWSAGCQVIADSVDFERLMVLAHEAAERYGNGFTYTLLNEKEVAL